MFARANRLAKKRDVDRVWKRGKRVRAPRFYVCVLPNNQNVVRCTVVVSLRVSKKATIRNRLKRRIREILRAALPTLRPGFDLLVSAAPGLERDDFSVLKKNVHDALKHARLFL